MIPIGEVDKIIEETASSPFFDPTTGVLEDIRKGFPDSTVKRIGLTRPIKFCNDLSIIGETNLNSSYISCFIDPGFVMESKLGFPLNSITL